MKRSTPLRRRTPLTARTPLRARSAPGGSGAQAQRKPPRDTGFSASVKTAIRRRAGFRCEACGMWLGEKGGQCQHILARGMGGSHDPLINSVINGALLCGTPMTGCHGLCEARDRQMNAEGFWLEHGQDPAAEPFLVHMADDAGGVLKWRTAQGGYSDKTPERQAA